jgi:hypothetical protein
MLTGKNGGDIINLNSRRVCYPCLDEMGPGYQTRERRNLTYPYVTRADPKIIRGGFENMRNLKKLLAVVLALCVIFTFTVPAFAADESKYSAEATKLNTLGLYLGTGNAGGEFKADLGAALTREAGIALVVRLMGKQADATAMSDADVTAALKDATDLKGLSSWAKKNMAYAVKAGWYVGTTSPALTLDSQGKLTGKALAAYILRAMGYSKEETDISKSIALLKEKAGITADQATAFAEKELKRDDAVGMMFGSLSAKYADGTTVIAKLVSTKAVDEAKAIAAGVYTAVTAKALDVSSAVAINSKVVEVTLGTAAVAADLTGITVKDSAAKDVAVSKIEFAPWATDGKDLLVTLGADTTAGTYYTLTAGTKSANFGGKAADTDKPTVSTVESTDYNQVTITFSEPVLLGGTVAFAKSYGDKAALASTTIAYSSSNVITVASADQTASTLYAATIKGYTDLAGNKMDDSTDKTFVGQAKPTDNLKVNTNGAASNNPEEAVVQFNLNVDTTTITVDSFKVEEAYGAKTVLPVTAARIATTDDKDAAGAALTSAGAKKAVILTIPGLKESTLYKVTVSNLKSTVATSMDSTSNNATFVGKAKPTTVFGFNGTPVAGSNTTITVKFARKLDKATAEAVANYAITEAYGAKATLAVSTAALQSNGTDVKLTVASMKADLYKIVVTGLKDIYGNSIDTGANSTTFVGAAVAAKIGSVTGILDSNGTILTLTFDQAPGATLTDVSHYFISDGVGYPSKAYADDTNVKVVKLVIPKTTDGKTYTVTVKGLENADKVAMDTAGISGTFVGKGNAATLPAVNGVVALSNNKIEIFFDRAVDSTGFDKIWTAADIVTNPSGDSIVIKRNYTGAPAIDFTAAYKDPSNANGLILVAATDSFKANQASQTYNTLTCTFDKTYILGTNSANTVMSAATSDTASYGPKMIGVVAVNKQQLTAIFDQPISTLDAGGGVTSSIFKAFSDTGMTKNGQFNSSAAIDQTDKTKVNVYFAAPIAEDEAGTSVDNQFMLQIPTANFGFVLGMGGLSVPDDGVGGTLKGWQSIAFAGSSASKPAGLDSGIYGIFTPDKNILKIVFPEPMDSTTIIPANITVHSYVGSTDTTTYTPAYIKYSSSDNTAMAYFSTAVIDSTSGVTSYKLEMTTSVHNQAGISVCADKSASPLATYKSQVAPGTVDAAKPTIASVTVDDTRTKVTVTFDREVVFSAVPDFNGVDDVYGTADDVAANGEDAERVGSSSVTATTGTVAGYFNLKGIRGDGTNYDHQLTNTNTEALYATGITRNTDNKSVVITLNAALQAGSNVQIKLLKTAAVYSWTSVRNDTGADGSVITGGVISAPLYDSVAPVFLPKASYGTDSDNDGNLNTITLVFDENISFVTAPTNQATARALFTTLTVADGVGGTNDLITSIADQTKVVISGNTMVITLSDTVVGTGTITVDLANGGIVKDAYGNTIGAIASDTIADRVAPVLLTVVIGGGQSATFGDTAGAVDTLTFTFSEPVKEGAAGVLTEGAETLTQINALFTFGAGALTAFNTTATHIAVTDINNGGAGSGTFVFTTGAGFADGDFAPDFTKATAAHNVVTKTLTATTGLVDAAGNVLVGGTTVDVN